MKEEITITREEFEKIGCKVAEEQEKDYYKFLTKGLKKFNKKEKSMAKIQAADLSISILLGFYKLEEKLFKED